MRVAILLLLFVSSFVGELFGSTLVGEACAHATLRLASPPDGAALETAPEQIELVFSEPVAPLALALETAEGRAVAARIEVGGDGSRLTLRPDRPLQGGAYLVRWRVASADGHPVRGRVAFAVGATSPSVPVESGAVEGPGSAPGLLLARTAHLAATVLAGGGALALCALPFGTAARLRSTRLVRGLLLAALAATLLRLAATGLEASGVPPQALLGGEPWRAAMATGALPALATSALGILVLIAALARAPAPPAAAPVGLGLVLAAGGFALTGHTATAPPAALFAPALALHVLLAMGWVGALAPLALSLRYDPAQTASAALRRFSDAALWLVPLVLLLGAIFALRQLTAAGDLLNSLWGRILLAKLTLVAGLLAIAAVIRLHLLPRLSAGDETARAPLVRLLAIDAGLAVLLLAATASLTATPPPRRLAGGAGIELSLAQPPLAARLAIVPGTAGWNRVEIELERPAAPLEVRLTLVPEDGAGEPVEALATAGPNGRFRAEPLLLVPAGAWRLALGVLLDPFTWVQLPGRFELPRAGRLVSNPASGDRR